MIDLKDNDASELGIRCRELGITATAEPGMTEELPTFDVSGMQSHRVHLRGYRPHLISHLIADCKDAVSVDFYQGSAHTEPPTVADVMYCVLSDASARHHGNFEDWVSEYGYDEDSRRAEQIYHRCLKTAYDLVDYFGEDIVRQLEQLEH